MNRAEHFPGHAARFHLEAFADIALSEGAEWLVEDVVPATGLTVIYGEAGCGKSFLASDMGLAVALGQPWAGKEVQSGTVVFIAAEGATGFRKRLVAYRQHYNIAGLAVPFHLIAAAPDLGHTPGDMAALVRAIEAEAERPIRAVIIDTLARTMHGADESSAADMGLFSDHCTKIGEQLGCAVLVLHHCGKDSSKGARGSSALRAAADCEILVDGSQERRTSTVTKAKDGEDGWMLPFKLNRVDIEAPGRDVSSCVLEILGEWAIEARKPPAKRKMTDRQKLAIEALSDIAVDGKPLPPEWQMPGSIVAVPVNDWREELYRRGILDRDAKNPRADFRDLKAALQSRKLVAERDGLAWRTV
jgi:hypothetical protein